MISCLQLNNILGDNFEFFFYSLCSYMSMSWITYNLKSLELDTSRDDSSAKHKSSNNSNIIRLSAIRDVIAIGKHALLDITPNAVERLNYAQMYPIVVFFKAEAKIVVKQLRQGLPK